MSGIMPVTSVRVRRPAMRPMEAQAPRGWIMPGGGAVGEAAAAAEGVVAVGVNDGVGWCGGWFGSDGGLAVAAAAGNGGGSGNIAGVGWWWVQMRRVSKLEVG